MHTLVLTQLFRYGIFYNSALILSCYLYIVTLRLAWKVLVKTIERIIFINSTDLNLINFIYLNLLLSITVYCRFVRSGTMASNGHPVTCETASDDEESSNVCKIYLKLYIFLFVCGRQKLHINWPMVCYVMVSECFLVLHCRKSPIAAHSMIELHHLTMFSHNF